MPSVPMRRQEASQVEPSAAEARPLVEGQSDPPSPSVDVPPARAGHPEEARHLPDAVRQTRQRVERPRAPQEVPEQREV